MSDAASFRAHKFRQLDDRLWQSLESSTYYFPDPAKLNDPADCQIDLVKAFRLARAGQTATHSPKAEEWFLRLADDVVKKAETCGVYSLCAGEITGDDQRLFWAHYAANHTGVCLTFDIPYAFISDTMVGVASVVYSTDALFDALQRLDLSKKPDFGKDIQPILTTYLTTKAPEWKYEQEARLISFHPGLQNFDRSWLKQICLGLRTPDADRERIQGLVEKYPDCKLAEAVREENDLFRIALREVLR
ncbi:DUF2971 domain-containing protein [Paraburkholderia sp. NPDC080076]|uniref:DUF2971 domain-containing protein n=1 Tax=Paraburkholderia sp. NPDC080076 TaxID=3390605 RepID=UPI003D074137